MAHVITHVARNSVAATIRIDVHVRRQVGANSERTRSEEHRREARTSTRANTSSVNGALRTCSGAIGGSHRGFRIYVTRLSPAPRSR